MLKVVLVCLAFAAGAFAADSCYNDVNIGCSPTSNSLSSTTAADGWNSVLSVRRRHGLPTCTAQYGAFHGVSSEMQAYANLHLKRSYEFLLSSTYFDSYATNREGFAKVFRKMSDDAWQNTIGLIKHITKRGGTMDFKTRSRLDKEGEKNLTVEVHELGSLAKALDVHKELAERAFHIHREATRNKDALHDAEVAHYLEEEFMEKQASTIRELAGHTNDLKKFIADRDGQDVSLAFYLFDEYLQKVA